MESGTNKGCMGAYMVDVLVGVALGVLLIILKAAGVITWGWGTVLSSFLWLTWIVCALTALVMAIVYYIAKVKRWYRRHKADARIIRQAKAAEVWDKKPIVLGGRALELKAWQDFKIKREPGEPDAHLRRRCMAAWDDFVHEVQKQLAVACQVPLEVLTGRQEPKNDQNQEGDA